TVLSLRYRSHTHRYIHSFPTRRSSDLSQTRGDPDAVGYMWGMAGELDDTTVGALAGYYAEQKTEPSSAGRDSALVARGREIYEHGIESEGVPACSSCHGPDAHGLQDFPRLAGQHAQYILKQLASFQSNMRDVAIMHGVAQNLRLSEMQSVAAYLQAQPEESHIGAAAFRSQRRAGTVDPFHAHARPPGSRACAPSPS